MMMAQWLAALALALAVVIGVIRDARAAYTQNDCLIYADLALVAASLRANQVPIEVATKVAADVYQFQAGEAQETAAAVIQAAYRDKRAPMDFTRSLFESCLSPAGMDRVLGVRL